MNSIRKNWNWALVALLGIIPLIPVFSMIQLDFSPSADSWISMEKISVPSRQPGEAARQVSGAHVAVKETGEWAIRWLVVILSLTPIAILTGIKSRLFVRQAAGIVAFVYATLHFIFFCIDRGWAETFKEFGYVLGLIAALIMTILAFTSNRKSMRFMRKNWKKMHRTAYLVALLAVTHVVLLEHGAWLPYLVILVLGFVVRSNLVKNRLSRFRSRKELAIAQS